MRNQMSAAQIMQIERIQKTVADFYKLPSKQMKAVGRTQPGAHQRQVAMFLARTLTGSAYELIAEVFNRREHRTIAHAVKTIYAKAEKDPKLAGEILSLSRSLKTKLSPFPNAAK